MTGGADPIYVQARRGLLDVLEVLAPCRESLVLVGAQAGYLRVGSAGLEDLAPHTTDADLALMPEFLAAGVREPGELLRSAGYRIVRSPGGWASDDAARIDLMVASAVSGPSRRSARVPGLDPLTAWRTDGIEAVLFDRSPMRIGSLDPRDERRVELQVAGPAALLIAKLHKIGDRLADAGRRPSRARWIGKDALDVHRLLRGEPVDRLAASLIALARLDGDPLRRASAQVVRSGLEILRREFAHPGARGAAEAGRAGAGLPGEDLAELSARFARELLAEIDGGADRR